MCIITLLQIININRKYLTMLKYQNKPRLRAGGYRYNRHNDNRTNAANWWL